MSALAQSFGQRLRTFQVGHVPLDGVRVLITLQGICGGLMLQFNNGRNDLGTE